jgi:hypothetical protein
MDRSGVGDKTAVSPKFTLAAMPPRLCAPRLRAASTRMRRVIDLRHVYQAEINLIDQCRGPQRVAPAFILHVPAGQARSKWAIAAGRDSAAAIPDGPIRQPFSSR